MGSWAYGAVTGSPRNPRKEHFYSFFRGIPEGIHPFFNDAYQTVGIFSVPCWGPRSRTGVGGGVKVVTFEELESGGEADLPVQSHKSMKDARAGRRSGA